MRPRKGPHPRKWPQVMNHPDVILGGAASAHKVAKQMKVERKKDQQTSLPSADPCESGYRNHDQRTEQPVKEEMMVHRIPLADTSPQQVIRNIHSEANAVDIRRNPSEAYPEPLARVPGRALGDRPTGEEMSDRTHAIKS